MHIMKIMATNEMSRWIVERRKRAERDRQKQNYYMTNLNNPIIRDLYLSWKREQGYGNSVAPGDEERAAFELSLFRPEVVARLEELKSGSAAIKGAINHDDQLQGVRPGVSG